MFDLGFSDLRPSLLPARGLVEESQMLIKITTRGFDGILTPKNESCENFFFYCLKKGNYYINKCKQGDKNSILEATCLLDT